MAREENLLLSAFDGSGEVDVVGFLELLTSLSRVPLAPFYIHTRLLDNECKGELTTLVN